MEKEDYYLPENPNADIGENITVNPSRLDVVRVYSTFDYDPITDTDNSRDYKAGRGWGKRRVLKLKPSSAQRLKGQIMNTLVRLAELTPLNDDEDDADDWGCSEYVVGDYDVRELVWIEHSAENDGTYEIKEKAYIKKKKSKPPQDYTGKGQIQGSIVTKGPRNDAGHVSLNG